MVSGLPVDHTHTNDILRDRQGDQKALVGIALDWDYLIVSVHAGLYELCIMNHEPFSMS